MVRRWEMIAAVILTLVTVLPMLGQDAASEAGKTARDTADVSKTKDTWTFYKIDLTVKESDNGKVLNTRSYSMSERVDNWCQLRSGSSIPMVFEMAKTQYVDVGLNLDSRVQENGPNLAFDWRMELSSVPPDAESKGIPVIRRVRSNGQSLLEVGKPTVLTSVDDLNSTHRFIFEVTATKMR